MKQKENNTTFIRVKFLGNYSTEAWLRQFPDENRICGNCKFIFDTGARDYDWLVVYNDFPGCHKHEVLACTAQRSILVTMEPPTIKIYGKHYTAQFGCVLTTHPEWALPHNNRLYSQCALQWFYGQGHNALLSYRQMKNEPPLDKQRLLSTVCSIKRQRHTLHNRRFEFTQRLKAAVTELDIFGHGVKEIDDKAEALDAYRYHIAIENYIGKHHWTEKLSDVFLGCALPFYFGCPNAADYFPEESFIPIDINDVDSTKEIIQKAIHDNEFEKRLPYILEARRRVMEEYNMFSVLSHQIEVLESNLYKTDDVGNFIFSRRLLRKHRPMVAVTDFLEKSRVRIYNFFMDCSE